MAIYAPSAPVFVARRARTRKVVLFIMFITAAAVFGPKAFATDASAAPVQLDTYTVGSGETLWSIAADLTPEGRDVRDTMADIKAVNAMSGGQLQAGEQILIPQS
ncbi:LysM peptidoglycan-binding domain-containing protein [Demequina sp.]|uniref:LysM peptidoglycan-binding domain-containing protein n=1 Tax=Demequina sp. TaxID=2050685 RepID=UPI003D09D8A7